jgi:molybdopterin synthase sulfur carrier subunit
MSIKVRYFASLRETIGRGEDELQASGKLTPRIIWQQLNADLPMPEKLLVAINMEYVVLDSEVKDDDELAFFPPVTGG